MLHLETLIRTLSSTIANKLNLEQHPDEDSFISSLGQPPDDGDKYYDTTLSRIRIWSNGNWIEVGGLVESD